MNKEINRPSLFAVGGCVKSALWYQSNHIQLFMESFSPLLPICAGSKCWSFITDLKMFCSSLDSRCSQWKKEKFYSTSQAACVFLCIAQRTEIAPTLVLNFLLFQLGALSQTTDVVLQNKIRPLLDEKPDSCACTIPGRDWKEKLNNTTKHWLLNNIQRVVAFRSTIRGKGICHTKKDSGNIQIFHLLRLQTP